MIERLETLLKHHRDHHFTGRLNIKSSQVNWSLFYCLGHIVWATGGSHPNRRFHRLWQQWCPQIPLIGIQLQRQSQSECVYYHKILVMLRYQKITAEQSKAIIADTIKEIIFDIIFQENIEILTYYSSPKETFKAAEEILFSWVRPEQILLPTLQLWEFWKAAEMSSFSPNLVPVLNQSLNQIYSRLSPRDYPIFIKISQDQYTLRDLALLLHKDIWFLSQSLMPYLQNNILELIPIADHPFTDFAYKVSSV
jgi:two-component system, chemotaxis family, response regulator PixG